MTSTPAARRLASEIDAGILHGVRKGFAKAVPTIIDTLVDALMNNRAYPVIVGAQVRLIQAGMKPREAWNIARDRVNEFLADEKVKVGHPGYDWSPAGGVSIIEEYELRFWEDKHD